MIMTAQKEDGQLSQWLEHGIYSNLGRTVVGLVRLSGHIFLPHVLEYPKLCSTILHEFHTSRCAVHSRGVKTYHVVYRSSWWPRLKKEVFDTVAKCLDCQQVKAEHERTGGTIQPLETTK